MVLHIQSPAPSIEVDRCLRGRPLRKGSPGELHEQDKYSGVEAPELAAHEPRLWTKSEPSSIRGKFSKLRSERLGR